MNVLNYDRQMELKRHKLAPVEVFLSTTCRISKELRVSGGQLYLAYTAFCKQSKHKPLSPIEFYARVDNHPELVKVLGKSGHLFLGVDLQEHYKSESVNDQAVAIFEGRLKYDKTPFVKEKLRDALRGLADHNNQICKLTPMIAKAKAGDPFWKASLETLLTNLHTAERLAKEGEVEVEALCNVLRARGEISDD